MHAVTTYAQIYRHYYIMQLKLNAGTAGLISKHSVAPD